MSNLSKKLNARLDSLIPEQDTSDIDLLIETASNPKVHFNSKADLQNYISEGVLLNVNKLSSKALSIPCGEYMVMNVGSEHSVLVPVVKSEEVHQEAADKYEIATKDLYHTWNKLEKALFERQEAPKKDEPRMKDATDLDDLFDSLPRSNADLAADIGVAEPSIGRWTAPVGSDSHRTPTVRHIKKISDMTGIGPCRVLQMALNQLSGGTKQAKNSKSGSAGGTAWGGND